MKREEEREEGRKREGGREGEEGGGNVEAAAKTAFTDFVEIPPIHKS